MRHVDFTSIRTKLMTVLLLVLLPLIALLTFVNFYAIGVVREQVKQANINMIDLHMSQIDRNLADVDKFLLKQAVEELNLVTLGRAMEVNPDQYSLAKIQFFQTLSNEGVNNTTVDYFFAYSEPNDDLILAAGQIGDASKNMHKSAAGLADYIRRDRTEHHIPYSQWTPFEMLGSEYLLRVIKVGNVDIGALVSVTGLLAPLRIVNLGDAGHAFLIKEDNAIMGSEAIAGEKGLTLEYKNGNYALTGGDEPYLTVGQQSRKGAFSLIVALPEREVLQRLPIIQQFISFLSYGSIVIIILFLLLIRKIILKPINQLVRAMKRIQKDQLGTRIEDRFGTREFEMMAETFNNMAGQIQDLKIDIYEEQLKHQKAELRHLQLQINPHFFLNSLNNIYYFAKSQDFMLIQEMTFCLIDYFRYMFRSNSNFVTLEDEVGHTENYLRIQQLRYPDLVTYAIEYAPELKVCIVPPLVIQTFAENSIKHAVSLKRSMHIHVRMEPIEEEGQKKLNITIEDTGDGFRADVLQKLRLNQELVNSQGEHIGIWNVKRRLQLMYGAQAHIHFSNVSDSRGARVEIILPIQYVNHL